LVLFCWEVDDAQGGGDLKGEGNVSEFDGSFVGLLRHLFSVRFGLLFRGL
jgi:hypothetical protein